MSRRGRLFRDRPPGFPPVGGGSSSSRLTWAEAALLRRCVQITRDVAASGGPCVAGGDPVPDSSDRAFVRALDGILRKLPSYAACGVEDPDAS